MKSSLATRRLQKDFKKIIDNPSPYYVASPVDNDLFFWRATINGPLGTIWEGGKFNLELTFGETFPHEPPEVKFTSEMYHPNIYDDGSICLDILQNEWSPILDIAAVLTSIQSLLNDPNPASPANYQAGQLYMNDPEEYEKRVKEIVRLNK